MVDEDPRVEIHPTADGEGVLLRVELPKAPLQSKPAHVNCDIVLVIDVSYRSVASRGTVNFLAACSRANTAEVSLPRC